MKMVHWSLLIKLYKDITSKSRFIHEVDQEIEVDSFDDEKYAEGFAQFISEKEVYEILALCILE